MKIVSSIYPPDFIQNEMKGEFPEIQFEYYRGMEKAEASFYDAEVFITYGEDLIPSHIEKAANLKWIMIMSAGMERMPFDACKEKSILVTNARGVHKIPMAEYALNAMLQHVKNVRTLAINEEKEVWDRRVPVSELCGKTVLIIGAGAIGGEIARLAKAFKMDTIGINREGRPVEYIDELFSMKDLIKVLPQADFVVSILPSTKETTYLFKDEHFSVMKDDGVFINLGRGDLVHEDVLVNALNKGQIAHAYLDVFEEEPLRSGHPFWKMDNVTVTPHLSSKTKNYLPRSFEIFKHNLHTYINKENEFINVIDLERGY